MEFFNNYFCFVFFLVIFDVNIMLLYNLLIDMEIFYIEVLVNEVRECLSNLDILKVCGFDGILVCFLKECFE